MERSNKRKPNDSGVEERKDQEKRARITPENVDSFQKGPIIRRSIIRNEAIIREGAKIYTSIIRKEPKIQTSIIRKGPIIRRSIIRNEAIIREFIIREAKIREAKIREEIYLSKFMKEKLFYQRYEAEEEIQKAKFQMIEEFKSLVRLKNPFELLEKYYLGTDGIRENIQHHLNIDINILDHYVGYICDGNYQHFEIFYHNLLTEILSDKIEKQSLPIPNNTPMYNNIDTVNDTLHDKNLLPDDEFFEWVDPLNLSNPDN